MATILPQSFDIGFDGKAPSPFVAQALSCTRELMWLYLVDAIGLCLEYADDATQFIGPLSRKPSRGRAEIAAALHELRALIPSRHVLTDEHYDSMSLGADTCSVTVEYVIEERTNPSFDELSGPTSSTAPHPAMIILCSFVWSCNGGQTPRLVLCHSSVSTSQMPQLLDVNGLTGSAQLDVATLSRRQEPALVRVREDSLQTIDSNGVSHWLSPKNVVYAKAAHQYTDIFCIGRRLRIRSPFSDTLEQLGDTVVRVHRSYAVNPAYLSHMKDRTLYLTTGDQIPIPTNRRREVRQLLLERSSKLGSRV